MLKEACIRVVWLSYSLGVVDQRWIIVTDLLFSHSINEILRGLQLLALSCCITCQDVCVQQSHAGLSFRDFKYTQVAQRKKTYSYNKNSESLCYEQKHMNVLIWIETINEHWFNYNSFSKFSAAQALTFRRHFLLLKTFFITLVKYSIVDISH